MATREDLHNMIETASRTAKANAEALKVAQNKAYEHLFGEGGGGGESGGVDPTPYLPAWEADRDTMTEVVVPEGVTRIGIFAFSGAVLNNITLSSTVEEISGPFTTAQVSRPSSSFGYETGMRNNLKKITFAENSNLKILGWSSLSGVQMDEIYIPDGVTIIRDHALALDSTSGTKYISLPSSLQELDRGSFSNNYNSMLVPPVVVDWNSTIYDITFRGKTKADVLALVWYDNYDNSWVLALPPESVLHCTDGDITVDENGFPVL